jgi:enamine deaminase RidA (YjgF/YER057c/UK114 family)
MSGEWLGMNRIVRYGVTSRWSDAVVHGGVGYFVEVPDDPGLDCEGQFRQVLQQVEKRLEQIGSDMQHLLQVVIYLPDPSDLTCFNEIWDAWVPSGHAPSRACIHAALAAPGYRVELVITAALIDA